MLIIKAVKDLLNKMTYVLLDALKRKRSLKTIQGICFLYNAINQFPNVMNKQYATDKWIKHIISIIVHIRI